MIKLVKLTVVSIMVLSLGACSLKMRRDGLVFNVNITLPNANTATAPALASVVVDNDDPSGTRTFHMVFGTITGSYTHYCINENNTLASACTWIAGTLPYLYTVSMVNEPKALSIFLKNSIGVSAVKTSNTINYLKDVTVSPLTANAALAVSVNIVTGGRTLMMQNTLSNGNILVFGGLGDHIYNHAQALEYNPTTNRWINRAPIPKISSMADSVVLANGDLFMAGSLTWPYGGGGYTVSPTSWIYRPSDDMWYPRKDMPSARAVYSMFKFTASDGLERVVVIGGIDTTSKGTKTTYIYNPSNDTWKTGALMTTSRHSAAASMMPDGRILVAGGMTSTNVETNTAEIYDPLLDTWISTSNNMSNVHVMGAALTFTAAETGLPYDSVVVHGGGWGDGTHATTLNSNTELLRLDTLTWVSKAAGSTPRGEVTQIVKIAGGKLLAVGGTSDSGVPASAVVEEYNVGTNAWTAKTSLPRARGRHRAILLNTGKILVTGGALLNYQADTPINYLYDVTGNSWSEAASFYIETRSYASVTRADGSVLKCGGYNQTTSTMRAECFLYDPTTGGWTPVGSMITARENFTLTAFPDGSVLAAGGRIADDALDGSVVNTSEILDPSTLTWASAGTFTNARLNHRATLLADNDTVIISGGYLYSGTYRTNAVKYSKAGNAWAAAGVLNVARGDHDAVLLRNGKVFIHGGYDGALCLNSAETYDTGTNTWTAVTSSGAQHSGHRLITWWDGAIEHVWAFSGLNTNRTTISPVTEEYNPALNTWSTLTPVAGAQRKHLYQAVRATNGKIYIFGGINSSYTGAASATVFEYTYAAGAGTWAASTSMLGATGQNAGAVPKNVNDAHLLPDGRILLPSVGDTSESTMIYSFVTPIQLSSTGGDRTYQYSLISGPNRLWPKQSLFVPDASVFSANGGAGGVSRILSTDGQGNTSESDITTP